MAHFELEDHYADQARIKVVGVGGAGGNALNTMIASKLPGVDFIAANTDVQALANNSAVHKIQLGSKITKGLGAGANPERGREAALESVDEISEAIRGADMIFVTAGMGGGTGTGAAPVIAQVAREAGALTVGVVTKPFGFEGRRRMKFADEGILKLEEAVDTLITIPNDRLLQVASPNTSMTDAFGIADEVLLHATQGVSDLITVPGLINVDFADVRTIMHDQGRALMGMGMASEEGRAIHATEMAINSPLLEDVTIKGARGILMNITAGPDLRMAEINEAASIIHDSVDEDCNIIFGTVLDENMGGMLRITVIATGFDLHMPQEEELGQAIQRHSARRSAPVINPMLGGGRIHEGQATIHGQVTPAYRGPGAVPPRRASQSQHGEGQADPAVSGRRRQPSVTPMDAGQTGQYQAGQAGQADAASGTWARGEVPAPEDHELPAYMRRQR